MTRWTHRIPHASAKPTPLLSRLPRRVLRFGPSAIAVLCVLFVLSIDLPRPSFHRGHQAWSLPPPISAVHRLFRANSTVRRERGGAWARPLVYAAVARAAGDLDIDDGVELFLFSHGVELAAFGRSLNVVGCLAHREIFKKSMAHDGLVACKLAVERRLQPGQRLSIVIKYDNVLQDIMDGKRKLNVSTGGVDLLTKDISPMPREVKLHRALLDHDERELRSISTDIKWGDHLIDSPPHSTVDAMDARYEVCIMTQEKVFPDMIPSWLEYHRRIGADMFYIYDNHARIDLAAAFADRTDVEVVYFPWAKSQIEAMNHFLVLARRRCEWALLIDVDEYIMVGGGGDTDRVDDQPLRRYLRQKRVEGYAQVSFPEIPMGSSGLHLRPTVQIQEAYVHRYLEDGARGKAAVRTDYAKPNSSIHSIALTVNTSSWYKPEKATFETSSGFNNGAYIVHYKYRSWEDWVRKVRGGRSAGNAPDWENRDKKLVSEPSPSHLNMSLQAPYTLFRDYWRRVSALNRSYMVTYNPILVLQQGGLRCSAQMLDPKADAESRGALVADSVVCHEDERIHGSSE